MDEARTREAEIFAEALQLPPAERFEYLVQACGSDVVLRRRVEELLGVQERVGDFMETPNPESGFSIAAAPEERSGRVGRYRLIEKIGEGGCGVVYRAEQEEPVRREVALKIIKPGMDTKEVIGRFEAERQALAMMDNPGIAKVLDAGQTESGRPYFVMELVRGTKITDYCDRHALSTAARLALFVQVCHAVQHAHQKGVIHRDIKPSNILVTTSTEGIPHPVVIDFGIAKATVNVRLTDKTLFTAVDMLIGTPTYMSPEQATGAGSDVDTRSDIYSLGVLLYELLTGVTPFDAGELLQLGIEEVRRAIREQEPPPPSARLGRMTVESLVRVAKQREAEPQELIRSVRGDLDWIVMKALEKDRSRRFATANGFAEDVKRYLSDETVSARPASWSYRLRKTAARNKVLFTSLGSITALLCGSLIVVAAALSRERRALAEATSARHQADRGKLAAEQAARKSQQVTRFLEDMLQGVSPEVARGRDTTVLREVLDQAVARIDRELGELPAERVELQRTIAGVYEQLGLFDQAVTLYREALATARTTYGNGSEEAAALLTPLAGVLVFKDRLEESETLHREALTIQRQHHGEDHPAVALALNGLAATLWARGDAAGSEELNRQALAIQRRHLNENDPALAESLHRLALAAYTKRDFPQAETTMQAVLSVWRHANPESPKVADALGFLAKIQCDAGRAPQAEVSAREAIALRRKLQSERHPEFGEVLVTLGRSLQWLERYPEGEAAFREAIEVLQGTMGAESSSLIAAYTGLAWIYFLEEKQPEAEVTARRSLELCRKVLGDDQARTAAALGALTTILLAGKKFEEADRVFADFAAPGFTATPKAVNYLKWRANYHGIRGRWAEGLADCQQGLTLAAPDFDFLHLLPPLYIMTGQREGYAANVAKFLELFGQTQSALVANHLSMDCLVWPAPGVDLHAIDRLLDLALHGNLVGTNPNHAACGKALLEYRSGRHADALTWAERAAGGERLDHQAIAHAIAAMACFRLDRRAEAIAALRASAACAALLPATSADSPRPAKRDGKVLQFGEWKTQVFARTLLAEAISVVGPLPPEPAPRPPEALSAGTGSAQQ